MTGHMGLAPHQGLRGKAPGQDREEWDRTRQDRINHQIDTSIGNRTRLRTELGAHNRPRTARGTTSMTYIRTGQAGIGITRTETQKRTTRDTIKGEIKVELGYGTG